MANSKEYKNVLAWRGSEKLYLNQRTSDVNFIFDSNVSTNGTKIPAHKCILSASSKAFDTMFYGSLRETSDVRITNASPEAFKEFLQFFYLSTVKLTSKNVAEVMNLCKQYMLNDCINACTDFCQGMLTMDNTCWGYELAILFEQDDLKEVCEQQISENPVEIFRLNSFLNCEQNLLCHILAMDSLNCEETVVFDGCIAWAKAACILNGLNEKNMRNLRAQLGDLFYEIRFKYMTLEHFYSRYRIYEELFHWKNLKILA